MIDKRGNMKLFFTLCDPSIEYSIRKDDLEVYEKFLSSGIEIFLKSEPPILDKCFVDSVSIRWDKNQLPFNPGIIQRIELQFCLIGEGDGEMLKWISLGTKAYYSHDFMKYSLNKQRPGTSFRFRLRYKTNIDLWSDFSDPSEIMTTLPDRPSR